MTDGNKNTRSSGPSQGSDNSPRLEYSPVEIDPSSGIGERRKASGTEDGDAQGDRRNDATEIRSAVGSGRATGVRVDPSEDLINAFLDGDFETAYAKAQLLADSYHEALLEASQLRFRVNFGTDTCQNCTGLHAGPGVIATCYQVRRCDYTHIKDGQEGPRKIRILQQLLK